MTASPTHTYHHPPPPTTTHACLTHPDLPPPMPACHACLSRSPLRHLARPPHVRSERLRHYNRVYVMLYNMGANDLDIIMTHHDSS